MAGKNIGSIVYDIDLNTEKLNKSIERSEEKFQELAKEVERVRDAQEAYLNSGTQKTAGLNKLLKQEEALIKKQNKELEKKKLLHDKAYFSAKKAATKGQQDFIKAEQKKTEALQKEIKKRLAFHKKAAEAEKKARDAANKAGSAEAISGIANAFGIQGNMATIGIDSMAKGVRAAIAFSMKRIQEAASVRAATSEARATAGTFISNAAEREGLNPQEYVAKSKANAQEMARGTAFSERQVLIAQGGLAEGGAGAGRSVDKKYINTLLDATVGRYNKVDVSEGQIQVMSQMLSRVAQTGKFGRMNAQFQQAGQPWVNEFEKSDVTKRFEMMFDFLGKTAGGLAEAVRLADEETTRSVYERNRTERLYNEETGRLGQRLKTSIESIGNNFDDLSVYIGGAAVAIAQFIEKYTKNDEDRLSGLANIVGVKTGELNYGGAKSQGDKDKIVANAIAQKTFETKLDKYSGIENFVNNAGKEYSMASFDERTEIKRNASVYGKNLENKEDFYAAAVDNGATLTKEQETDRKNNKNELSEYQTIIKAMSSYDQSVATAVANEKLSTSIVDLNEVLRGLSHNIQLNRAKQESDK